ncbi:DUF599 domain-containing protein [Marinospirillum alkaliphilum]|uniref:Uncharacterized membrane protein n=1 Tax=Marinospirillum alkaliphilum DSM 21637 TaxID=1122209 RepID=A0A1K1XN15_9GAMM|nr:DUF599 family protein [Marinospirillum alkaliphilum]SFX50926.1 Uncharacterized membrane protein [Marinospirillum alkaliphilum DSM 21637]
MSETLYEAFSWLDWAAFGLFVLCWGWYYEYSRRRQRNRRCLAGVMHGYRYDWMKRLLDREARIADATIMTHLERNGAFFASSTLLILAAMFGLLGAMDRALAVITDLPFASSTTNRLGLELKLLLLVAIFIYAFFTFTWSMRQYNFCAILIGSAPLPNEKGITPGIRKAFAIQAANVIDLAANQFNYGLRAYYFGLALLGWFLHPLIFMVSTLAVVGVLYRREFHSKTLKALTAGRDLKVNFRGILQDDDVHPVEQLPAAREDQEPRTR